MLVAAGVATAALIGVSLVCVTAGTAPASGYGGRRVAVTVCSRVSGLILDVAGGADSQRFLASQSAALLAGNEPRAARTSRRSAETAHP